MGGIWHACGMASGSAPPDELIRSLIDGPSLIRGVEWHDTIGSTNVRAAELGRQGAEEIQLVLADVQTEGRGRRGRQWQAPPGTSLLASWLLRPRASAPSHGLLSLLAGLVVAEVAERHLAADVAAAPHRARDRVALKWPNDVQVGQTKLAGVLAEKVADCVIVGTGVNVDWRGMARSPRIRVATSLAEQLGRPVDRWRVLAGMAGVFSRRYESWGEHPEGFLLDYRARCATLGRRVRIDHGGGESVVGVATAVESDGRLAVVTDDDETVRVSAGDVEHLRHAPVSAPPPPAGG